MALRSVSPASSDVSIFSSLSSSSSSSLEARRLARLSRPKPWLVGSVLATPKVVVAPVALVPDLSAKAVEEGEKQVASGGLPVSADSAPVDGEPSCAVVADSVRVGCFSRFSSSLKRFVSRIPVPAGKRDGFARPRPGLDGAVVGSGGVGSSAAGSLAAISSGVGAVDLGSLGEGSVRAGSVVSSVAGVGGARSLAGSLLSAVGLRSSDSLGARSLASSAKKKPLKSAMKGSSGSSVRRGGARRQTRFLPTLVSGTVVLPWWDRCVGTCVACGEEWGEQCYEDCPERVLTPYFDSQTGAEWSAAQAALLAEQEIVGSGGSVCLRGSGAPSRVVRLRALARRARSVAVGVRRSV